MSVDSRGVGPLVPLRPTEMPGQRIPLLKERKRDLRLTSPQNKMSDTWWKPPQKILIDPL